MMYSYSYGQRLAQIETKIIVLVREQTTVQNNFTLSSAAFMTSAEVNSDILHTSSNSVQHQSCVITLHVAHSHMQDTALRYCCKTLNMQDTALRYCCKISDCATVQVKCHRAGTLKCTDCTYFPGIGLAGCAGRAGACGYPPNNHLVPLLCPPSHAHHIHSLTSAYRRRRRLLQASISQQDR